MNNERRVAIYTRDRATPTPAQRRRIAKRMHQDDAPIKRSVIRKAKQDVVREAQRRKLAIRVGFMAWRAGVRHEQAAPEGD